METKQEQRLHARNLYFATGMSQQEIADQCNISRKTLYLWMNEGGWRHAKYAAAHAPALLLDQYYEQLGKLNQHIASRENPWPTKDEATTIRKITMSINYFKESTSTKQTTQIFHDFIKYLQFKENKWEMAKEFILPIDRFVKQMMEDKNWLSYNFNTMHNEEQHFQREYAEWLKTQKQDEQPDVILSSSKDILSSSKDILSQSKDIPTSANGNHTSLSFGEGRGEVPPPADVTAPVPVFSASPSKDELVPTPENVISTPPKSTTTPLKKPVEPQPQTFWQLRQQQESARLGTNPPVKAQPHNPNSQSQSPNSSQQNSNANSAPRAITYTPGTQPKGTPVPHPTQTRHLTNLDIQKMMETPQPGQQPDNFNPKRY